jgi:hypothetical protein
LKLRPQSVDSCDLCTTTSGNDWRLHPSQNTGFRGRTINSTTTYSCSRILTQLVNDRVLTEGSRSRLSSICTNRSFCCSPLRAPLSLSYQVSPQCRVTQGHVSSCNRPHVWRRTSQNTSRNCNTSCLDTAMERESSYTVCLQSCSCSSHLQSEEVTRPNG